MVLYILLVAVVNLALGYALAKYIERNRDYHSFNDIDLDPHEDAEKTSAPSDTSESAASDNPADSQPEIDFADRMAGITRKHATTIENPSDSESLQDEMAAT